MGDRYLKGFESKNVLMQKLTYPISDQSQLFSFHRGQ
jgi:hypothetical protein